jgi:hypothetical protein
MCIELINNNKCFLLVDCTDSIGESEHERESPTVIPCLEYSCLARYTMSRSFIGVSFAEDSPDRSCRSSCYNPHVEKLKVSLIVHKLVHLV